MTTFSGKMAIAIFLLVCRSALCQHKWLTDEEARHAATETVNAIYPEDCYSTYRKEALESFVLSERLEKIVGREVNRSVYIYDVVADACAYVSEKEGSPVLHSEVHTHEPHYGLVAVDRRNGKTYWFNHENRPGEVFKQFVHDEQIVLDKKSPILFVSLYLDLACGANESSNVQSLHQLRRLVEDNFESAYSPYERDQKWEPRFAFWWKGFRSNTPNLELRMTSEPTEEGVAVHGYSFEGFELTIPRMNPPPKGTPALIQWNLRLKPDGSAETLPSKIIYRAR